MLSRDTMRMYYIALRNTVLGMNLATVPLVMRPRKMVQTDNTVLFYLRALNGGRKLEQKNIDEVFGSVRVHDVKLDTKNYFWGTDPSYVKDIVSLSILARALNPKRVFEIGTLDGYTALHFAMNSDASVFTLDLPPDVEPSLHDTYMDKEIRGGRIFKRSYRWTGTPYENRIIPLLGDSATFDYSPYTGNIDLFFIDGAHSYEYVRSDSLNALKCVKKGGVIAWHDYGRMGVNGVSKWLHELNRTYKIYSVPGSSVAFMRV